MPFDENDKKYVRDVLGVHNRAINQTFKKVNEDLKEFKKDIDKKFDKVDTTVGNITKDCSEHRSDIYKRLNSSDKLQSAQQEAVNILKNGVSKQGDRSWGFLILVISMLVTALASLGTLVVTLIINASKGG